MCPTVFHYFEAGISKNLKKRTTCKIGERDAQLEVTIKSTTPMVIKKSRKTR